MTGLHGPVGPGVARFTPLDGDGRPAGASIEVPLARNVTIGPRGTGGPGVYAPVRAERPWWADEVVDLVDLRQGLAVASWAGPVESRTAAWLYAGPLGASLYDLQVTWLRARRRAGGGAVPGLPRGVFPVVLAALRQLVGEAPARLFMVPDDETR